MQVNINCQRKKYNKIVRYCSVAHRQNYFVDIVQFKECHLINALYLEFADTKESSFATLYNILEV